MLCGFPAKLYSSVEHNLCTTNWEGRSGIRGSDEAKALILLKLVEWVNAESVAREYLHTLLRISKLIRGKELFQLALGYAVKEFDCPQYYYSVPGNDCESDGEDSSQRSDDGMSSTADVGESSMEYEYDGIDVHAIPDAKPEQTKYDDLDRQLGKDETLSNRVLRMHSLLSEHYSALHHEMDTLKVDLEHGPAGETKQLAWHSWFDIVSEKPVCNKASNLRNIARGDLKPGHMLRQYGMMHCEATSMDQEKRQQVLENLKWMLDAAKLALEDTSVGNDGCELGLNTFGTWNLSNQFESYRYPWQSSREKTTIISNICEDAWME